MVIKWAAHKTSFMVYEKGIFLSEKEHFQLVKPEMSEPIRWKRLERICSLQPMARTKIIIIYQSHLKKTPRASVLSDLKGQFIVHYLAFFHPS